jgi:hypothetical protein
MKNGKHPQKIKFNYENKRGRSGEKKHVHLFFGLASFCNPPPTSYNWGGRVGWCNLNLISYLSPLLLLSLIAYTLPKILLFFGHIARHFDERTLTTNNL